MCKSAGQYAMNPTVLRELTNGLDEPLTITLQASWRDKKITKTCVEKWGWGGEANAITSETSN